MPAGGIGGHDPGIAVPSERIEQQGRRWISVAAGYPLRFFGGNGLYLLHSPEPAAFGAPLYSAAFADQASGTVVDSAPAPTGGHDLLAVAQIGAADTGDVRLGSPEGAPLTIEPLPYAIPPAAGR